ncbi:MAG: SpoIIE family protein phosphatase [Acidimicrobiales bacterium]
MAALDDADRLAALQDSGLLGGDPLPGLDGVLRIARHVMGTSTVMFTAVDVDRQVFVDHIGLNEAWASAGQTPLSHSYCRLVVTGDAPLVVRDAPNDERVRNNPATAEASIGAYLGVPVRSVDGHILGSLCALDGSPRAWTNDQIRVLTDLAGAIEVELTLRDTTRELADRLTSESLERGFEESMTALAAATSRSWTVDAVVRSIVENAKAATGAAVVTVALHEDDTLRIFDAREPGTSGEDGWHTTDIDTPSPMTDAARNGRTLILPDPPAMAEWPEFADTMADLDLQSYIAMPVGTTDSGARAVIGVGWTSPMKSRDMPRPVARLATLARHGLDRAHSHETARVHAELLETLVLPETLPSVPDLDIAGVYLPPSAGQRVGGDLYDAVTRDDGRIALIVADAAGHDVVGSLVTSRVRNAFTMLSLDLRSPAHTMRAINRYLMRSTITTHITAVVALVDLETGTVTIANAGHLQPRLRRADGRVDRVGPAGEPLLGLQTFDYHEAEVPFDEGDRLLLFTDGLIEWRDRPLTASEQALDDMLGALGTEGSAAAVDRLSSALPSRDDDLALMLLTRRAPARDHGLELEWPAAEISLGNARSRLSRWLDGHPRLDDIVLIATELLTNARTASDRPDRPVTLRASRDDHSVCLRVTNHGPALPTGTPPMPDAANIRGRGLAIVAAVADLRIENVDGQVTVEARLSD